jgi:Tol biopolymer transport system component
MSARHAALALVLLASFLVTGCGAVEPTATPVPATATRIAAEPSSTPLPPSATPPPPAATVTSPPPTDTPQPRATVTVAPPTAVPGGGGLIAFASNQDGDWDIYTIEIEQGSLQQLTHNDADDLSPSWSPDGRQIAFVSNRDGNEEIYTMNVDGSGQRRLTETTASESFPAWSPDGKEISFDSNRDGNWEIYVMASDGSHVRRLTNDPADDWISSWSPGGSAIVFESKRDGNYEIYVMDARGGNQQRLTDNRAHDGFPAWSPDGAQIAFMSQRDGNYEIYVMDADGTNPQRVTDSRAEDSDPAWSPDGEWLTFVSQRDGNDEIYIVRSDGSLDRRLTTNASLEWGPAWQPVDAPSGRANTWIRAFEGLDYGAFFDIVLTQDGNALAAGATNHVHMPPYSGDALLMKLTLEGDVLWERTWGGDGYEQAWSVALAEDRGYYIFGETDSYGSGDRDFFLLKTTEDGSEEWFKTYGGSGREWPYGMLRLSNGELLMYGFTEPGTDDDRDQYALCVGPDGAVIWQYTVPGPGEELVIDAIETADGDLVLAVIVEEDSGLVKLDADGNTLWTKRYELAGWQFASQIAPTDDGGFLLAGFSMSSSPRRQADTWLARCAPVGELEWEKSFGDAAHDDYGTSLIRLKGGDYLIGGIGNGMLLSRVDLDGNLLWRRSLVGQSVYGSEGLIELEDGGYLVAGFVQITNGRSYDAILLRTDAEGQITTPIPPTETAVSPTATNVPVPSVISVDTADRVERLAMLQGHGDRIIDLAFSDDGAHLASSSLDRSIKVWDAGSLQELHTFPMTAVGFNGIALSPDGRLLASADAIWDLASKEMLHGLERGRRGPAPVDFSPDGSLLAIAPEGQAVELWDVTTGEVVRTFAETLDEVTFRIVFSPDGTLLAACSHEGTVRLWDVESGEVAGTIRYGRGDVHDADFSPDGQALVTGGTDQTVRLWDVASGQELHTLRQGNGLYGVAFSPDGELVASAGCDRTVKLWDAASGKLLRTLPHAGEVLTVAFSPDGTLLASGGYDDLLYLWGLPR